MKQDGLQKLEEWIALEPQYSNLVVSVKTLRDALNEKRSDVLYAMRPDEFKSLVSSELYSNTLAKAWNTWVLDGYSVLGIHVYGEDRVRLVVQSIESGVTNYDVAVWSKSVSGWQCMDMGLVDLPLSRRMEMTRE